MTLPTLETPRLRLRDWREDDYEPFAALNADPRVMEHFPRTLSRNESDELLARLRERSRAQGFGPWAVEVSGVASFIGMVGLTRPGFAAPFTPAVEVLWRLAAEHWGRGYAPEAAAASLDYGFDRLELAEIVAYTAEGNVKSRRVMEKLGMRHAAGEEFAHPALPDGHPLRRHVLYRLSREAWVKRRPAFWGE